MIKRTKITTDEHWAWETKNSPESVKAVYWIQAVYGKDDLCMEKVNFKPIVKD